MNTPALPQPTESSARDAKLARLVEDLETLDLPAGAFRHRQHVQAAWWMIDQCGLTATLARFPLAIQRFAEHHGARQLYHETITWYFLLLVNERRESQPEGQSWSEFESANPDLFDNARRTLLRVYSETRLDSELARRSFLLPDRPTSKDTPSENIAP